MAEKRLTRRRVTALSAAAFAVFLAGCSDDEEEIEPADPDEETDDDLPWTDD